MILGEHHKTAVPLSSISKIVDRPDSGDCIVHTLDGDHHIYRRDVVDDLYRATIQSTFPAVGIKILLPSQDTNGREDFYERTVLAFAIDATGELLAVTADGNLADPVLLLPDGSVERFEERFASVGEYRAHIQG